MINQKAISVKVYDDILEQFDAQLGAYEKRNQAINKAMKIYVELKKWREKIELKKLREKTGLESENAGQRMAMQAEFFQHAIRISKSWRVG